MKKKHRNPFISRLLAMCLAAVMMLSMGITASAALTSTGSFTVSGFDTNLAPTVTAYQIITVNIDDAAKQPEYPMYTWAEPVATWLKSNDTYKGYVDEKLGTDAVANAFADGEVQAANMTKFLEELAAAIKNNSINGLTLITGTVTDGTASFANAPLGEYLIIASGGVKIYQPTTVKLVPEYKEGAWTVGTAVVGDGKGGSNVKGSAPQIDKSVSKINGTEPADRTVAVGDTVTFKLAAKVPDYPIGATNKMFIISDKVGTGLEYQSNTVKVYRDVVCEAEITSDLYTLKMDATATVPNRESRTFVIEFKEAFFNQDSVPENVYVTYEAKVTANAFATNVNGKLDNDAFLGYSNDPYNANSYTEDDDEETLYTYAIDLTKVDTDGNPITKAAMFELKKQGSEKPLSFTGSNGVYTHAAAGTQGATTDLMTSTTDGTLKLQGLDEGVYILTETNAPDGYVLPNGTIEIELMDNVNDVVDGTLDKPNGGYLITSGGAEIYGRSTTDDGVDVNDTMISFKVVNKTASEGLFNLPVTGGAGTVIFTMAGILLMGGAVALLVVVLRRKRS